MEVTYDALQKQLAQAQKQIAAKDQRIAELEAQLQEAKLKLERNRSISQYKDDGFGGSPMQYDYYANR